MKFPFFRRKSDLDFQDEDLQHSRGLADSDASHELNFGDDYDEPSSFVRWIGPLAIVFLTTVCFLPVLTGSWIGPDQERVAGDLQLRSNVGLSYTWRHPFRAPALPLGESLLWAEYQIFGAAHAGAFHAISLLLHLSTVGLLWMMFLRFRVPLGGWITAAYAVHPVVINCTAVVSNQPLLLAMSFSLGAILCGLTVYASEPAIPDEEFDEYDSRLPRQLWRWLNAIAAILFTILAIVAHPIAWLMPLIVMLMAALGFAPKPAALSRRSPMLALIVVAAMLISSTIVAVQSEQTHLPLRFWDLLLIPKLFFLSLWRSLIPAQTFFEVLSSNTLSIVNLVAICAWLLIMFLMWQFRRRIGGATLLFVSLVTVAVAVEAWSCEREGAELIVPNGSLVLTNLMVLIAAAAAAHWLFVSVTGKSAGGPQTIQGGRRVRWVAASFVLALTTLGWLHNAASTDQPAVWARAAADKPWSAILAVAHGRALAAAEQTAQGLSGNRLSEATIIYEAAWVQHPFNRAVLKGLTNCYARQQRFDAAIDLYRQAIAADASDASLYNGESQLYAAKGVGPQAMRLSQIAVELDPRDAIAHHDLGLQLDIAGRLDEAAIHYGNAMQLDPLFCAPRINLATLWFRQGKVVEASQILLEATRIDPVNFDAYANAGAMLATLQQWSRAEQMLRAALRLKSDSRDVWRNLGLVLKAQGKAKEAQFVQDRVARLSR